MGVPAIYLWPDIVLGRTPAQAQGLQHRDRLLRFLERSLLLPAPDGFLLPLLLGHEFWLHMQTAISMYQLDSLPDRSSRVPLIWLSVVKSSYLGQILLLSLSLLQQFLQ